MNVLWTIPIVRILLGAIGVVIIVLICQLLNPSSRKKLFDEIEKEEKLKEMKRDKEDKELKDWEHRNKSSRKI